MSSPRPLLLAVAALLAGACGRQAAQRSVGDGGDNADLTASPGGALADLAAADIAISDFPPPVFMGAVYAHSATELYSIDPQTLDITFVGTFSFGGGVEGDSITDIALDKNANMVGISYETLYKIDRKTAACTRLASIGMSFNALSYIAEDQVDQPGDADEILVAANLGGEVYRLNPDTGAATLVGRYGDDLISSGDIVSVKGFGTVATVKHGEAGSDLLASIDFRNGAKATVIGDTGDTNIFGLGFWGGRVFGFTEDKHFDTIDVKTGAAHLVRQTEQWWWGAGVSTWAPVTIQ